jgi:branched-chain amino acid transport system substrate-binding protein
MELSEKPRVFILMMGAIALAAILAPVAFAGEGASPDQKNDGDLLWNLLQAEDGVSKTLADIDRALLEAGLALSDGGIEGERAREVLDQLSGLGPFVVDCITIDLDGIIVEVMPEEYQHVQGMNIRDQEHIERLLATRRPAGLAYIESVEGFRAMDFASPVFDEVGRLIGAVTVLVNSTVLFGDALAPHQPEGRAKIWAMTPDGTVIYDSDADQIGRNTFIDPLFREFPDLLAVAERVEMERSGRGAYSIFGTSREVYWTTIDHQGSEIRLLLSVDA